MLLTYTGKDILVLATRLAIYVSFESTSAKTELVKSPYGLISRLTVMALTVDTHGCCQGTMPSNQGSMFNS